MYHFRKTQLAYRNFPKPSECPFCNPNATNTSIETTKYAYVMPNRTSYDMWELRRVTEHLMVIPRKHVRSLADLSDAAKIDIVNLVAKYEKNNYNVYARAPDNIQRSVSHQHTHLIKTEGKRARLLLFSMRPYWLKAF